MHRSALFLPSPRALSRRSAAAASYFFSTNSFHDDYSDDYIRSVLSGTKTIAMVGASTNWNRPSFFAMKYLQGKGYRVIPVNPRAAGETLLGETVVASLKDIPTKIDMVDVFRPSSDVPPIAQEAIDIGAKYLWMQLGIVNEESRRKAEQAGLSVVMNRCPKIEFSRLYGELGWQGFDSHIISSKRRPVGKQDGTKQTPIDENLPIFDCFETKAIHAGASPCPTTGARATPIYQTTAYVFDSIDQAAQLFNLQSPGNIYTRMSNPTTSVLEQRMSSLEGGRGATCTASGHAAQMLALFPLLSPGDKLISSDKLYGGSLTQFSKTFRKFGWQCDFVDVDDIESVKAALAQDNVKCLFCESIANPGGAISDLDALSAATNDVGVPLVVDNTLATPYFCQPIQHGATLVVHSTTKFISGHGNSMGGCVVDSGKFDWAMNDKFPSLAQPEEAYHGLTFVETFGDLAYTTHAHAVGLRDLGATMAPMNAFLTITGCETLSLRMTRHVENALVIAKWFDADPRVEWVSYAGLESSPYYELGQKYTSGGGSVFTFGVKGGFDASALFVERCQLFSHLANMGDTRSLILHPASTTHRQLTQEMRERAGAGDDVIRLSIGLENVKDLIKDLDYALG